MRSRFLLTVGLCLFVTGAWAADIRVTGQIVSEYAAGPPFQVNSITKVLNLNADRVDGMSASEFASAADLATADSGIDVHWKNIVNLPVTEIDQDCALSGGCDTGSDFSGFPVTITQAGNYRLASNLSTTSEDVTLIEINVSDVVLDLNGFALRGPVTCSGSPAVSSCSPSGGTGDGINVLGGQGDMGARIFNGSIKGMGDDGIDCPSRCTIKSLVISHNGDNGIEGGAVTNQVRASFNGGYGINVIGTVSQSYAAFNGLFGINGSSVSNSTAQSNGASGITGDTVVGSTAINNQAHGIAVSTGGTVLASYADLNQLDGIHAESGGIVKGNSARRNDQDGISVLDGMAVNNTVHDNGRYGFRCEDCMLLENTSIRGSTNFQDEGVRFAGTKSVWGRNMVNDHTTDFSGTVADMGGNFCDGSAC